MISDALRLKGRSMQSCSGEWMSSTRQPRVTLFWGMNWWCRMSAEGFIRLWGKCGIVCHLSADQAVVMYECHVMQNHRICNRQPSHHIIDCVSQTNLKLLYILCWKCCSERHIFLICTCWSNLEHSIASLSLSLFPCHTIMNTHLILLKKWQNGFVIHIITTQEAWVPMKEPTQTV